MALSTKQAAEKLGVSQTRVRELLTAGLLEGEHVGRSWTVCEESVAARLASRPKAGRPKRYPDALVDASEADVEYDSARAHDLYELSKRDLTETCSVGFLSQIADLAEKRFCVANYNAHLREKQRELVAAGVF